MGCLGAAVPAGAATVAAAGVALPQVAALRGRHDGGGDEGGGGGGGGRRERGRRGRRSWRWRRHRGRWCLLPAAAPRAVAEATRLAVLRPAAAAAAAGPRWLAVQEPLTAAQALGGGGGGGGATGGGGAGGGAAATTGGGVGCTATGVTQPDRSKIMNSSAFSCGESSRGSAQQTGNMFPLLESGSPGKSVRRSIGHMQGGVRRTYRIGLLWLRSLECRRRSSACIAPPRSESLRSPVRRSIAARAV